MSDKFVWEEGDIEIMTEEEAMALLQKKYVPFGLAKEENLDEPGEEKQKNTSKNKE